MLSHTMVDVKLLQHDIPSFKIKVVNDSTGNPATNIRHVEVHPVEWDAQIVFSADNKKPSALVPINNVVDLYNVDKSTVKLSFHGRNDKQNDEFWVMLKFDKANESDDFIKSVESLKDNAYNNEAYWSRFSLNVNVNVGRGDNNMVTSTKTIDIYPLAPFLFEEEYLVWHNTKTEGVFNKKVVWLEAVTNYRIFSYDYKAAYQLGNPALFS